MEFIGEGAAHVAFGAIAFALFFNLNMNVISLIVAIVFAVAIHILGKKRESSRKQRYWYAFNSINGSWNHIIIFQKGICTGN